MRFFQVLVATLALAIGGKAVAGPLDFTIQPPDIMGAFVNGSVSGNTLTLNFDITTVDEGNGTILFNVGGRGQVNIAFDAANGDFLGGDFFADDDLDVANGTLVSGSLDLAGFVSGNQLNALGTATSGSLIGLFPNSEVGFQFSQLQIATNGPLGFNTVVEISDGQVDVAVPVLPQGVPAPMTLALLAMGLLGMGAVRRRQV